MDLRGDNVGCLKLAENAYKGRNKRMGRKNKGVIDYKKMAEELEKHQNCSKKGKGVLEIFKYIGAVLAVITPIVLATLYLTDKFAAISTQINGLQTKIDNLQTQINNLEIEKLESEVEDIDKYLNNDGGVRDQLGIIMEALNIKVINVTEDDAVSALGNVTVVSNDISHTTSGLTSDMTLGVDANGNVYMADELIGETILLTYQDEGKDVFFLGQYTEELKWDGYCVTNAFYPDGTLYSICETSFDNGKRLDYKTIVRNGDKESSAWGYYCRTSNEQVNTGVSIEYTFDYFESKNFTSTNVRRTDIRYVDDFVEAQEKTILKYYYGNTKDGLFHDDTGDAVYIKLDADGTVRSVYKGGFSKGYFDDTTGNAWNLVYWDEAGYYICNSGDFKDGTAVVFSPEKVDPDSKKEEIDKMSVPFELRWKE